MNTILFEYTNRYLILSNYTNGYKNNTIDIYRHKK